MVKLPVIARELTAKQGDMQPMLEKIVEGLKKIELDLIDLLHKEHDGLVSDKEIYLMRQSEYFAKSILKKIEQGID